MKKLFTILTFIFIQYGFSQEIKIQSSTFQITIESLPELTGVPSELIFEFHNKGTYSFKLASELVIPENYNLILKDSRTGNTFNLQSKENHSFTINRAMSKQFFISFERVESLSATQKELLNMLLL